MELSEIVDLDRYPLMDHTFIAAQKTQLDQTGVLALQGFITPAALEHMRAEGEEGRQKAYFCTETHSVYLSNHPDYAADHPANRQVVSSKGCICDDDVPAQSPLRALYNAERFRRFICAVTGEAQLYPYADPLSSINIHYAERGQELGWHFDNSSFAITLLIQKPTAGSRFEYVSNLRNAEAGDMNYNGVAALLEGKTTPDVLDMEPGTLVLFRGRNSIHRVSPNESDVSRMLAVLAYNTEPDIALSENARMTFYGRLR